MSDFILAVSPAWFLRHVKISLRVKICLCVLMGLGVMYDQYDKPPASIWANVSFVTEPQFAQSSVLHCQEQYWSMT